MPTSNAPPPTVPALDLLNSSCVRSAKCWFSFLENANFPEPLQFDVRNRSGEKSIWREAQLALHGVKTASDLHRLMPFAGLQRARANVGDARRWHRVLAKAARNKPITLAVFGGSVTAGNQCLQAGSNKKEPRCAWPARLETWLQQLYGPKSKIKVVSLAAPATGTEYGIALTAMHRKFLEKEVDAILVDYTINDLRRAQEQDNYLVYQNQNESWGWPLSSQYDHISSSFGSRMKHLMVATENLVRQTLSLKNRPALLWLYNFEPTLRFSAVEDIQGTVVRYYGVPVLSYRAAFYDVWRGWADDYTECRQKGGGGCVGFDEVNFWPCAEWTCCRKFCDNYGRALALQNANNAHGPWYVHEMYTMMVAFHWAAEAVAVRDAAAAEAIEERDATAEDDMGGLGYTRASEAAAQLPPPIYSKLNVAHAAATRSDDTSKPNCAVNPGHYLVMQSSVVSETAGNHGAVGGGGAAALQAAARMPADDGHCHSGCGWHFGQDVAGKPGWLMNCTAPCKPHLAFPIKTDVGIVEVGYLSSYSKEMGRFAIDLIPRVGGKEVAWSSPEVQAHTPSERHSLYQFARFKTGVVQGDWLLRIKRTSAEGTKIKIVQIASC